VAPTDEPAVGGGAAGKLGGLRQIAPAGARQHQPEDAVEHMAKIVARIAGLFAGRFRWHQGRQQSPLIITQSRKLWHSFILILFLLTR
jgi:hypothetical protein